VNPSSNNALDSQPSQAMAHNKIGFEIRPSSIHGMGAFATRSYAADDLVAEYMGERISKSESVARCAAGNTFIFTLNSEVDLDGNVSSNPARFFNHSCVPNCEARRVDDSIWLAASRQIQPGEELTFNYGYDLVDYREYPCHCGAVRCVGFIVAEEFFETIKQRNLQRAEIWESRSG
jgi:SET domain-containing protein